MGRPPDHNETGDQAPPDSTPAESRRVASTVPEAPSAAPPALGPRALGRWAWRQLTSMRTALILLFLLALASIPGSVIPQDGVDAMNSNKWRERYPTLTPIYEFLGFFNVYSSPWFSAIYILLMISLVGCIVPRTRIYWKGLRAQPPATPRRLQRLPEYRSYNTNASSEEVMASARRLLRRNRIRKDGPNSELSAEKGYLREAGNLVFHLSILVVLVGVAMGSLLGFKGATVTVVGQGFSNALSQYDEFKPGPLFQPSSLKPFSFKVDNFNLEFIEEGRQRGMAHQFEARLTYRAAPGKPEETKKISVNNPISIDGTNVYLISHGYAPRFTVRDGSGQVAFSGPVVFMPEDETFTSFGVVKVPDAENAKGETEQMGFEGEFYPTYVFSKESGPMTVFPDAKNPAVSMLAYSGDLGLNSGKPQSVYVLDKSKMKPMKKPDGKPLRVDLGAGQKKVVLPNGKGSIEFDGVSRFVRLQISETPGEKLALGGVVIALIGLLGSLFIRPRRIWVRTRTDKEGRTLVEVAGLDRGSSGNLGADLDELVEAMRRDTVGDEPQVPNGGPDDGTAPAPTQEEKA